MIHCYLGLGSNLRTPVRQLRKAIQLLRHLPRSSQLNISPFYVSKPLSKHFQPTYCNAVVSFYTTLTPCQLLQHCQTIEARLCRIRKTHWGSRTIDLDLLLYGQQSIHNHRLKIPHPEMLNRDFVIMPLLDIAPNIHSTAFFEIKAKTVVFANVVKQSRPIFN